jgi:hypothetical protein
MQFEYKNAEFEAEFESVAKSYAKNVFNEKRQNN